MLDLLLTAEFVGVEQLRVQAESVAVAGRCDCGCPTVHLLVPAGVPAAPLSARLVPCEGEVAPAGDDLPGQIILFVEEGMLSAMEYVYFDEPPKAWPDPGRVRVIARSS